MTQKAPEAGTDGRVTVSVSSTGSVTTRMPSPAECWRYGFARAVPVLAVRDATGKERLFAADRTALSFGRRQDGGLARPLSFSCGPAPESSHKFSPRAA